MIIGLSGKAGSGKDTVAQILVEEFGYKRVAFGDKIKECLLALDPIVWRVAQRGSIGTLSELVAEFGWDYIKQDSEVRRLLQRMGTEVGRNILWKDIWVNLVLENVSSSENVIITDVRFSNELQEIYDYQGKVWRIERDIPAVNSHSSETELDDWEFDRVISNNGTLEELANRVREAMG